MARLTINGKSHELDVDPDTPLLWVLREQVGLTGTKYGCGIAQCGACTVHVDGVAVRSCSVPLSAVEGKQITTIEGLAAERHAAQGAEGLDRPRRAAVRLLPVRHDHGGRRRCSKNKPKPTDADIDDAITNICRCGTFQQVREAIHAAAKRVREESAMNHVPKIDPPLLRRRRRRSRRRARARPRASVRRHGRRACAQARRRPRLNAWVVDQARRHRRHPHRPLRDGPGHAHRPRAARRRRTRMRLVEGHDRISDARPERRAQARLGRLRAPAAAAASARRTNTCARAARRRARCSMQAAANEWKVPVARVHASPRASSRTRPSGRTTTYGKVADAAAKLDAAEGREAQGSEGLEDRRQAAEAARHRRQGHRQAGLRHRPQAARACSTPRSRNARCSAARSRASTPPRSGHAGRARRSCGRRLRGRRRGRYLVAGQDRARRAADRVGRGRERQGLERVDRRDAEGRPRAPSRRSSATRTATPRPRSPARRRRSRRSTPIPTRTTRRMEPMNATALYTADKCEVWVPTQNGEAAFARGGRSRPACRPTSATSTSSISAAASAGAARSRTTSTQAVLIAKQMPGTPMKLIWSREEDMLHGRYHPIMQAKLVGGFDAKDNLTGLHIRLSGQSILAAVRPAIGSMDKGMDPLVFQGLLARAGEHALRLHRPEPADRPRDAQSARPAGLLARREHQPERHLHGMLHGRARAGGRPGRARVPAQADGSTRSTSPCSTRWPRRAAGASRRRRACIRGLAQLRAFGSYVAACAEISVSAATR